MKAPKLLENSSVWKEMGKPPVDLLPAPTTVGQNEAQVDTS